MVVDSGSSFRKELTTVGVGIWFSAVIVALVGAICAGLGFDPASYMPILAFGHMLFGLAFVIWRVRGTLALILAGGLCARAGALAIDRFASFNLPFMDSNDAEGFHNTALVISDNLSLAGDTYGGWYTGLIGYLFHWTGRDPLLAQYVNVLLGWSAVLILAWILVYLNVRVSACIRAVSVVAFLPTAVIYSAVLLREALVLFLISGSLLLFIVGLLRESWGLKIAAFGLVLGASIFHAGSVGVFFGYAVVISFTYMSDGQLRFGFRNMGPAVIMALACVVVLVQFPDLFLGKFLRYETASEVLSSRNARSGGSAYLTGLEVNNWGQFILFAPIRAFYFISVPLPWDWRGVADIAAFVMDSSVYIGSLWVAFRGSSRQRRVTPIGWAILLPVLFALLIFGAGVSNSGTAMRHRSKLIVLFLAASAVRFRAKGVVGAYSVSHTPRLR